MRRAAEVQPVEAAKVLGNALGILLGDATGQKEGPTYSFGGIFMTFYERMLEEIPWLREAREEGREEGKAEGLSQGELLGMREVALRTLANRFDTVPAEIEAALQTADKEHLFDVATHAGTDTLEEVRARLGLPERQS